MAKMKEDVNDSATTLGRVRRAARFSWGKLMNADFISLVSVHAYLLRAD